MQDRGYLVVTLVEFNHRQPVGLARSVQYLSGFILEIVLKISECHCTTDGAAAWWIPSTAP